MLAFSATLVLPPIKLSGLICAMADIGPESSVCVCERGTGV